VRANWTFTISGSNKKFISYVDGPKELMLQ
jgi:hypothetical protein